MSASLKILGLKDLQDQLLAISVEVGVKAVASAARKAMVPVLEAAKERVPIWSGALRYAIKLSATKPGEGPVAVAGLRIGADAGYNTGELPPKRRWHFIEFGTSKSPPHPFLRSALDTNAQQVLDVLKVELQAALRRAIKRKGR